MVPSSKTVSRYTCGLSQVSANAVSSTRARAPAALPASAAPDGMACGRQTRAAVLSADSSTKAPPPPGAHQHHPRHLLTPQPLAQHESVLGADGDDQHGPGREAVDDGLKDIQRAHF